MATEVHPNSSVDPKAQLGAGVRVGPFAVVGPNVVLGDGAIVHPHAVVDGHTTVGAKAEIFPGAVVGMAPQDLKYDGSPTRLEIGAKTVVRECATLHPGSVGGRAVGVTKVGEGCLIMAYCHVAHDCVVGDHVVLANAVQLAGHVTVEDHVILGGLTNVHQFCRIGTRAFTGAATRVSQDVPPYLMADGHPARMVGLNLVGLKRAGLPPESISALKRAYRRIFMGTRFRNSIKEVEAELGEIPEIRRLVAFLESSERGITRADLAARGKSEAG
jgi:UDP-N-acetylglucosamine acyltransferase